MMRKVLLYAYFLRMPSSIKISKKVNEAVAFRIFDIGKFPDFRTVNEFRRIHPEALKGLFVKVLEMCKEGDLAKLGIVSLDGTKTKPYTDNEP